MHRTAGIPVFTAPRSVRDVNPYMCTMKPLREGGPYHGQLIVDQAVPGYRRCCCQKDDSNKEVDKTRLKWEQKRRQNFINKCCEGLLATPCCSVGSNSEMFNETREPAEFFVQCDCSKGKDKKKKSKKKEKKRTVVPKRERDAGRRKTAPCICRDIDYSPNQLPPRPVDSYTCSYSIPPQCPEVMVPPSQHYGYREPGYREPRQYRNPPPDLSDLIDQLKCLVRELRAQRKQSERFSDYRYLHQ